MTKLCAALLIFVGESLSIYAEVKAAVLYGSATRHIGRFAAVLVLWIVVGGVALLGGYVLGLRAFKNVWVVGTISVSAIVLCEPLLAYGVTGQAPSGGALWAFVLSVTALVIAFIA